MSPLEHGWKPSWDEQKLLLKQFEEFRVDQIRDFMRDRITGLSNNKPELVKAVRDALTAVDVTWTEFVDYIDSVEPYRKQRVHLYSATDGQEDTWSADALKAAVAAAGEGNKWGARKPVAAPDELQLSAMGVTDDRFELLAVGKRTYRRRVRELEDRVETPRAGLEVQLYEFVDVRAWVRLELDLATGNLAIRSSKLETEKMQTALHDDFIELLAWFPETSFQPLNLSAAIEVLHETETDAQHEARVQAVTYASTTGLRSAVRSSAGGQSVSGHSPQLDTAVSTLREHGVGQVGNFFFLPPNDGGPPGTDLEDEVRVSVHADTAHVDFPRPMKRKELEHVLRRVRVLTT